MKNVIALLLFVVSGLAVADASVRSLQAQAWLVALALLLIWNRNARRAVGETRMTGTLLCPERVGGSKSHRANTRQLKASTD